MYTSIKFNDSSKKQKSSEDQESDEWEADNNRLARISNAFGAPVRNKKIKRVRSSFHLDEHWLREWNGQMNGNMKDEFSPVSDSPKNKVEPPASPVRLDPKSILKEAFKSITAFGSSTAWICSLQNQTFKVANLGDSTCMLIRFNTETKMSKIILKTDEQQHNFNAPYQLAKIPDNLKDFKISAQWQSDSKKKFWRDKISDSCLYQWEVREGDIVLWATDGLFDNLYSKEIIRIVDVFMSECMTLSAKSNSLPSHQTFSETPEFDHSQNILMTKKNAKRLAKELVKEAYRKSKSKTCFTPFGDKFDKTLIKKNKEILKWKGGKPDDICAVVGFVKSADFFAF
jgi:serine/threonine protein phosphatase PrpC